LKGITAGRHCEGEDRFKRSSRNCRCNEEDERGRNPKNTAAATEEEEEDFFLKSSFTSQVKYVDDEVYDEIIRMVRLS
jgi:hypothetical protein